MRSNISFVVDRGMEGVNYEIEDYEIDQISFTYQSINIQLATVSVEQGSRQKSENKTYYSNQIRCLSLQSLLASD